MFTKSIAAQRPFKLALLASLAMAAMASAPSFAGNSDSASASANILLPITVTKANDLAFGKFIAAAGTVTIDTAGARTASGPTLVASTVGAASFNLTGEPSAAFTIDTTGTSGTLGNGTDTMGLTLISDLNAGGITSGTATTGSFDGSGNAILYVGGQLTVGGTESHGSYTGTVAVAVNYQ